MGGVTIFGAITIGVLLLFGQHVFPDYIIMWFASPDSEIVMWRVLSVVGLIVLAVVRQYYHNPYLRTLWSLTAIALAYVGGRFFIDNPIYIFDVLLLLGAGVAFAIEALQPSEEPATLGRRIALRYARMRQPVDHFASWRYISDARDLSHRLVVQRPFSQTFHIQM